jgi:DNA-directed RNA polymerase subunit M/transcription elongation factor TFIIS
MPDNNELSKLIVELKTCVRCENAFMVKKGEESNELVCENCIKLEQRKRELQIGVLNQVIEVENKMENSIKEMKNQLTVTKGTFNKQFFLEKIKRRSQCLQKSIELIEKIEDTNEEKYIDEYKDLFSRMKREIS